MQTYRTHYEGILQQLIEKQIEEAKDTLAAGFVPDFAAYREVTGIIRGLQIALTEMAEADRICQERS